MAEHQDARLELEASIVTLRWAGQEQTLRWDENRPYPPALLAPFVEILGRTVTDAVALKAGALHLEFSGNVTLAAVPDVWEGWHFYSSGAIVHGDDGRLII
jgi:hypothetical protein